MTHTAKHTPHSNIEGAGECPNCGADISPNDIDKPCWDCGGQAMNTAKHTPGPWKWSQESIDPEWAVITSEGGNVVANVNSETGPDIPPLVSTKMPQHANANLIAAAPTMYEALETVPLPKHNEAVGEFYTRFYAWYEGQRKQALAQAEGRQA